MNPRAALTTYSLSRGAPSASWVLLQIGGGLYATAANYSIAKAILPCYRFIRHHLLKIKKGIHPCSGEDGIRTHVAVKPNGFQDRPVMTASVPLQISKQ